ncbi:MAG: hypothetical protein J6K19_11375 [Prevotella sp.]|nr:hypothetical protein [Prevotella sp.]
MDEILEARIKYLETLLKRYNEISEMAGISFKSQEETIDKMLKELETLYKQRMK